MRYIDADELSSTMYEEAIEKGNDLTKWDSGCWIRYKFFENVLNKIPTADVAPVKHGKWLYCWSSDLCAEFEKYQGFQSAKCSVCNISQSINTYQHKAQYNYCPYCGAKMDGEREEPQ